MNTHSTPEHFSFLPQEAGTPGATFWDRNPRATSEQINSELFEQPEVTLPPVPTRQAEAHVVPPEQRAPKIITLEKLAAQMTAEDVALRETAEGDGMRQPRFAIVAGLPFGDNVEELLEGAVEYAHTGEVPGPIGDGMSYFKVLVRQCADAGVEPLLYVGEEVRRQGDLDSYVASLGLDPEQVFASNHTLGVLEDLARLQAPLAYYERIRNEYASMLQTLQTEADSKQAHRVKCLEDDIAEIELQIARHKDMVQARLTEEDEKVARIVATEDANEETDGVIAIMMGFTGPGMEKTRMQFKTTRKDVDGLSLYTPRAERMWDEATSRAMAKSAEYVLGYPLAKVPRKQRLQLGLGQLVGRRLRDLWNPGRVIDGRENVQAWGADHGQEPVTVLMSAVRTADIIKANKIVPARRGPFGLFGERRLVIVDGGVYSYKDPITGKREIRYNLDPASIPADGSVEAVSGKNTVGLITAAIAVGRVIRSAILAHETTKKVHTPQRRRLGGLSLRRSIAHAPAASTPTERELVNA
jgi:hypothetical protein